jgi:small subunit ribosomal protein S15
MEKVTSKRKQEIFKEFGGAAENTGSVEGQVSLYTERILHLTEHVKKNRKDFSNTKQLTKMVGKRRKLLSYLAKKDILKYRELIKTLGIRR